MAMSKTSAAKVFAELGNETRLDILRVLMRAGYGGLSIGEINEQLSCAPSTLAFHLRGLVEAHLVSQEKQGRTVICRPNFDRINDSIAYLKKECCMSTPSTGSASS